MTSIEWTEKSWNPISGCTKVSAGCRNCYAEGIANRFWGDRPFSDVQFHENRLTEPLKRKKPTMWFVNSMSDLFHESVTDSQLDQIFAVMALTPQHTYQCLTKRPSRMLEYCDGLTNQEGGKRLAQAISRTAWMDAALNAKTDTVKHRLVNSLLHDGGTCLPLPNVWLGVSVENQKAADERISLLLQTPAAVRFLSCEPLLEEVALMGLHHLNDDGSGIDWVIVGGESGAGARPCDIAWIRSIISQCKDTEVPVFVKQLGTLPKIDLVMEVGAGCIKEQAAMDRQWPTRTIFGNPTSNTSLNGSIALLKSRKGGDPEEWPEDLRVRQYPTGGRSL